MTVGHQAASLPTAGSWTKILNRYREPDHARSVVELIITLMPLTALWIAAWYLYSIGLWWVSLLVSVPAAGFLVRMFMIQHDCGHGAFFADRRVNDWVGRVIGLLTLTPYDFWRRAHAIHHSTSGNLDGRGIGDIETMTLNEYRALSWLGRVRYRLYRNPVVLFVLGPAYVFLLRHRLPFGFMRGCGWEPWISTQATNAGAAILAGLLVWQAGIGALLVVHLPIVVIAASIGVWLFYVQHQFEETFWRERREWNLHEAALHGSSHYDLPPVLRWFTANIGIHHVHHLASRIPYYRLPAVLRDHPELGDIGRLTFAESIRCVPLVLWDEEQRRLISFREAARRLRGGSADPASSPSVALRRAA